MPASIKACFLLLSILKVLFSINAQDDTFLLVGKTSKNKTLLMSTYPSHWADAHYNCQRNSYSARLAAIESREETNLLTDFIETTYGPSPPSELLWTAGTYLGGDMPSESKGTMLRWSTTGQVYNDWTYANWCCVVEPSMSPIHLSSWRLCVAAEYRMSLGTSGNYTVSWSMQDCMEPRRFICMTYNA